MGKFEDVSICKAANILFDGNITSRIITFKDGTKKTLGIMLPGEYELNTVNREIIDIQSGSLELLLPAQEWARFDAPTSFEIPSNTKFKLKVHRITDYCCSFLKQ